MCPLMEASSHGKEGNQINCMSVNRITSSLTCHESGLKLITCAWRNGRMGRSVAENRGGGQNRARGFPCGRESLLHTVVAVNGMENVCVRVCVEICTSLN